MKKADLVDAVSFVSGGHGALILRKLFMAQGTVKFFSDQKGYGFITPDDGSEEVFVHYSAIDSADNHKLLHEGDKVEYEVERSSKGLQAASARVI